MISAEKALECLRTANAVPNLDELDPEELAGVTALLDARRSAMPDEIDKRTSYTKLATGRRWHPALAFVGALILVAAVVGVVGFLPAAPNDDVVSPEPTIAVTTTSPPATTKPVDTTPAAPALVPGWTRLPHDAAAFGDGTMGLAIAGMVQGENGIVAVGSVGWQDGAKQSAAWFSTDGESWIRAPHDDAVFGPREGFSTLNDVVAYRGLFLATGCSDTYPQLLVSYDGTSWLTVDLDGGMFNEPEYEELLAGWSATDDAFETGTRGLNWTISGMASSGDRIVAVGSAGYGAGSPVPDATFDGDRFAAVWTSTDGITWTRLPHDETVFGGLQDGVQSMAAVAATRSGFVAVGAAEEGEDFDAAVWTSPDGLSWTRVAHDEAVFGGDATGGRRLDQTMTDVVTAGTGLVAVGTETAGPEYPEDLAGDDSDAAIWISSDGVTWQRIAADAEIFGGSADQWICCAAGSGDGVVAVGYERTNTSTWDPLGYRAVVWTSPDGAEWVRSGSGEFGEGSFMQSVAIIGSQAVAAGGVNNDDPLGAGTAAVWIRE